MLIKRPDDIKANEITPEDTYPITAHPLSARKDRTGLQMDFLRLGSLCPARDPGRRP